MPKIKKTEAEMKIINKALSAMKVGETKTVIVGPGRQGKFLVKKGEGGPVGDPTIFSVPKTTGTAKVIMGKNLPKQVGTKKSRSKVIKSKEYQ